MPLIYLSCAWITGIFLGSNFNIPATLFLAGLLPLPLFFFARRYRKTIVLASLMLVIFFSAAAYSYASQHTLNERHLRFYNESNSEIRGIVATDPEIRDKVTHLKVSVREIKTDAGWQPVEGTALVFVPRYPAYRYGDELELKGKLSTPSQLADFDYRGYLAHQGIYTTILYPEITVAAQGKGFAPLDWLYSIRQQMAQALTKVLPEPQAALAEAIILGIRETMSQSLKDDFARTGTTHLLAISGLNLTIITGMLVSLGIRLFGRRHYLYVWLALGAIWFYALLTAMNPPVVRAAIMASLFLITESLGRQRSAMTALCFAAAVMVGLSPYILGDAGFQMSFLAMASLIFIAPFLQNTGRAIIKSALGEDGAFAALATAASDSLSISAAAITAVWPVVAYYFGIFSPVGPLATFLALPVMPAIISAGALTAVLGLAILPLAQVMGWLTWLFLSYMLLVVNLLAKLPFSSVEVDSVSTGFIWGYYAALSAAIWVKSNWRRLSKAETAPLKSGIGKSVNFLSGLSTKLVILPLFLVAELVTFTAATMPDDNLHVSFLDVGEGDAILIRIGNQQVLIDGGPSPQALNLALGGKMPFWDRTIDLVVLTHLHSDHLAGLVEILQRFNVNQVLYADTDYDSPVYDEWQKLIADKKTAPAQACQQIDLGDGARLEVLHPQAAPLTGTESDIDNNSVVLRLSQGAVSFLFAADIMSDAERELVLQRANLVSTVLKVPHHGSATSTTSEFLTVVNPQIAVISAGTDNKFGHPDDEVVRRLESKVGEQNICRTDRQGTVEFITDGVRLWVKTTD